MKKDKGQNMAKTIESVLATGSDVRVVATKRSTVLGKEIKALNKALKGKRTVAEVTDALSDEIQRLGMDKCLTPRKRTKKTKKKEPRK